MATSKKTTKPAAEPKPLMLSNIYFIATLSLEAAVKEYEKHMGYVQEAVTLGDFSLLAIYGVSAAKASGKVAVWSEALKMLNDTITGCKDRETTAAVFNALVEHYVDKMVTRATNGSDPRSGSNGAYNEFKATRHYEEGYAYRELLSVLRGVAKSVVTAEQFVANTWEINPATPPTLREIL